MNNDRSSAALAAEAWQRIFGFFMRTRRQRDLVLERLGLTPNDAKAISSLDEVQGHSMRALADEWLCDASNATWMVDRLERRGFAERRGLPGDKRVKLVVLTSLGAETRQRLLEGMNEPPPELLALGRPELEVLVAALVRLSADSAAKNPLPDRSMEGGECPSSLA